MKKRVFLKTLIACSIAASSTFATPALAKTPAGYPDQPINVIVPFPPGGLTDLIGRRFAEHLEKQPASL